MRQDKGLPPYILTEQSIPPRRMGSKEPVKALGINTDPTASGLTTLPKSHNSQDRIEQGKIYLGRGNHYGISEKPETKEISRNPQG